MQLVLLFPATLIAEGKILIKFRLVIGFVTITVLIAYQEKILMYLDIQGQGVNRLYIDFNG